MSKRFKLKFPSINIPSFQFCRLKGHNSFPKNPKPAKYRRSPVNPKAFDIGFPSLPPPPPSTPECTLVPRRASPTTRVRSSDGCDNPCRSRSRERSSAELPCRYVERTLSSLKKTTTEKYEEETKKKKNKKKPARASPVFTLINSDDDDDDDDSLVLLDSSRGFSSENYPFDRRPPEPAPPAKSGARSGRSAPAASAAAERKVGKTAASVRESVAVVKKSEDPYEDFKRSMLEMIMEKQMFEAADLEELLQVFLTLNSRQHHGVIVEAFSEIWEILFCDYPVKHRLSV